MKIKRINQKTVSQIASGLLERRQAFALCRAPGIPNAQLFAHPQGKEPSAAPYFTAQAWDKSHGSIYFLPFNEALPLNNPITPSPPLEEETSRGIYESCFWTYQEHFALLHIQKAILSRIKRVELPSTFNVFTFFERLCDDHPRAFVTLMLHPELGLWIGASPEQLIVQKKGIWSTMSLAGTQPSGKELDNWTVKESHEQELVSKHIRQCLRYLDIEKYAEQGPFTLEAGSVAHLCTKFEFEGSESRATLNKILEILHPTPAVAGMPVKQAMDLISLAEKHKRSLYTGYWGLINSDDNLELYVNLRCMRIEGSSGNVYVGGGLTAASDLDSEWRETEHKARTLLNIIDEWK